MEDIIKELNELRDKYNASNEELERYAAECSEFASAIKAKDLKIAELTQLVKLYEESLRLNRHRQFGQSSEKTDADARQTLLVFDEAENEAAPKKPEPAVEEITYTRRKRAAAKEDNFDALPTEVIEHTVPEEERICPECGGPMHVMSHDVRREITFIPATVKITEHRREVCACRRCERENTHVPIIKAKAPEPVIKGSAASSSLIAHIMVQKYTGAAPLYRQEYLFANEGILLSRQTMSNWIIRAASDWLAPLYSKMQAKLLQEEILHADETRVQVLREPGRAARQESYMWLYRTGRYAQTPATLFQYTETRSGAHPRNFLKGYKGYLTADGYSGYKTVPDIRLTGCWAHLRRKFYEAMMAAPASERKNCQSYIGLEYCDKLFALERAFEDLTAEERYERRLKESRPITDEFYQWAAKALVMPKSALGKAIGYALEQRPYLEAFYSDGRLEISNNRAERSIKPFVIGRKNWLFCCSPKGAASSAVIYSIIETAKENGLNPFEYLNHVLATMPNIDESQYQTLLPWSPELPDRCRLKKQ